MNKTGKAAVGVIALLAAIAIGVFIYLLLAPQAAYDVTSPGGIAPVYQSEVFRASVGSLNGDSRATTESVYNLQPVLVDYRAKSEQQLLRSQLLISKSAFNAKPKDITFYVSDINQVQDSKVQFFVSDRSGIGSLIIKVNGEVVFDEPLSKDRASEVTIPKQVLFEGENTIRFTTSSVSWRLWSTNAYLLSGVYMLSQEYPDYPHQEQVVVLRDTEILNANEARITAYVKKLSESGKLQVLWNGETLYDIQIPSQRYITIDVPLDKLRSQNIIRWSTDPSGYYAVSYAFLTLESVDLDATETEDFTFTITKSDWVKIQTGLYECELYVDKNSGDSPINIEINNDLLRFSFLEDTIDEDVCTYLKEGLNKIEVSSDASVDIGSITFTIKNK